MEWRGKCWNLGSALCSATGAKLISDRSVGMRATSLLPLRLLVSTYVEDIENDGADL